MVCVYRRYSKRGDLCQLLPHSSSLFIANQSLAVHFHPVFSVNEFQACIQSYFFVIFKELGSQTWGQLGVYCTLQWGGSQVGLLTIRKCLFPLSLQLCWCWKVGRDWALKVVYIELTALS